MKNILPDKKTMKSLIAGLSVIIISIAAILGLTLPVIHAQTTNNWNIKRNPETNDLDFYLTSSGVSGSSLRLNSNGSMLLRNLYDLNDITFLVDPNESSRLKNLTIADKLGVGISAPQSPVEIWGGSSPTSLVTIGAGGGAGGDKIFRILSDSPNAETLTYTRNGFLGLGNTTPGNKIGFTDVDRTSGNEGLTWYNPAPTYYGIYKTPGAWADPYQQLKLAWETGIVLYTNPGYGKGYVDIQGGGLRINARDAIDFTAGGLGAPQNHSIRSTPNLHLNAPAPYGVIVNYDNGAPSGAWQFRVGNGAGGDVFIVRTDGVFFGNRFVDTERNDYYIDPAGQSVVNHIWTEDSRQNVSDISLKKDIKPLTFNLDKIQALKPVSFYWKQDTNLGERSINKHLGLIAQDVEAILPEIVAESPNGYKGIAYDELTSVVIGAIQEQQDQLEIEKTRNDSQDKLILELQNQIEQLKKTQ